MYGSALMDNRPWTNYNSPWYQLLRLVI